MASFSKSNRKTVSAATSVPAAVRAIAQAIPDTTNKAGGQAFRLSAKYRLLSLMATSFFEDQFYRTKAQTLVELRQAITDVNDPLFVAKAAIYVRNEFAMRSVTHAVAADIAKNVKGETWTKLFYNQVVRRVDDAYEILAAYLHLHGKPIPNSLKKGLGLALSKFDAYQLAKYKGQNGGVKLVDLFNLVHPKPNEKNQEAFRKLIEGDLASTDTFESELSAAGQNAENEVQKSANKAAAWKKLVGDKKIGYFALLRNLRNIMEQADDETLAQACTMLQDAHLIEKSLVLPFRFMTAYGEIKKMAASSKTRQVMRAIDGAVTTSLANVPKFPGKTLVALDTSGSMGSTTDPKCPLAKGALFAGVLAKVNDADIMLWDDSASYLNYNPTASVTGIVEEIQRAPHGGGTALGVAFKKADKKYDRVIILSDFQSWAEGGGYWAKRPTEEYAAYCKKHSANPKIYSFDLQGYGTTSFPEANTFYLCGFSDKTMDIMTLLEQDQDVLINLVNAIQLG